MPSARSPSPSPSPQARHWRSAAVALEFVRRRPQPTRRELAQALGLASGPASDLVGRLRAARLVTEHPVTARGPGRPTAGLRAHPDGPVALVVDLRHADWRLAAVGLDGSLEPVAAEPHTGRSPGRLVNRLHRAVASATDRLAGRAIAVAVAVPGLVEGTRVLDATVTGWRGLGLAPIGGGLPVVAGNDATLAAVAEARAHATTGALVHLVLEVGIGGALVVDGRPVTGARGLAGEFGHLPFGDAGELCRCGARGCWGVPFDPQRIAVRLGEPEPADPRAWLHGVLQAPPRRAAERRLRADLARRFGRGIAGLVNALDPDLVTLGGLAGPLRDAAPDAFHDAFRAGLMDVHRPAPPEIATGAAGQDAVLVGGALTAFDRVLDAERIAAWAGRVR